MVAEQGRDLEPRRNAGRGIARPVRVRSRRLPRASLELQEPAKPRRRRWPLILYSLAAIVFVTLSWLVVTAPLSRALEPLDDPALLISEDGHPIARRGAVKEAPVDVTKLARKPPPPSSRSRIGASTATGGSTRAASPARCSPTCAAAASVRAEPRSPSSSPRPTSSPAIGRSSARRRR